MKRLLFVSSLLIVFMIAPMAMADMLTVNRYSGYFAGAGGEFTLSGPDLAQFQPYYSDSTKNQIVRLSIQSFCLERDEFVQTPGTYFFEVNTMAVQGGINTNAGDPISIGTAWLYHQFQLGVLEGYDYTPGDGRAATAGLLQNAIWWLEQENISYDETNIFMKAAYDKFGGEAGARADNNGAYAVAALNLYNRDGSFAQDMLVCVPEPATMLLIGTGMLGLAGFARRRFKK